MVLDHHAIGLVIIVFPFGTLNKLFELAMELTCRDGSEITVVCQSLGIENNDPTIDRNQHTKLHLQTSSGFRGNSTGAILKIESNFHKHVFCHHGHLTI